MNRFELAADCETIISADDLTIYLDRDRVERAVYACEVDGLPLPSCDPESYGFGLVMLDAVLGDVAIAQVANLAELVAG